MTYALSLLDKSPLQSGENATQALRNTVDLARLAERTGYRRFWVAEHHNAPELASSSPEVLIAWLLASTRDIRIGSGGVMLQHYSAYKVAENFNVLAALAPGRVDIGVGKAPGGLPLSTNALQAAFSPDRKPEFARQLSDLTGFLDSFTPPPPLQATPRPETPAERFLLGASPESARLAAAHDWNFVFARHLNGDDALLAATLSAFRDANNGQSGLVAVAVIVDEDGAAARKRADDYELFKVHVPGAQSVTVGSEAQARDYARQVGAETFEIERKQPSVIAGTPSAVIAELDQLHREHGVEEFIIELVDRGPARLLSLELLAQERAAFA